MSSWRTGLGVLVASGLQAHAASGGCFQCGLLGGLQFDYVYHTGNYVGPTLTRFRLQRTLASNLGQHRRQAGQPCHFQPVVVPALNLMAGGFGC